MYKEGRKSPLLRKELGYGKQKSASLPLAVLRLLASDLNAWWVLKGMMKNMVEIKLGSLLVVKK